jgi:hypothetical protein
MWVPGALVYVGVALALVARWIADTDRATQASDLHAGTG